MVQNDIFHVPSFMTNHSKTGPDAAMRHVAKLFQSKCVAIQWSVLFACIVLISGCSESDSAASTPPSTSGALPAVSRKIVFSKSVSGEVVTGDIVAGATVFVSVELDPRPATRPTYVWTVNERGVIVGASGSANLINYAWKNAGGIIFTDVKDGEVAVTATVAGEGPITATCIIPWRLPTREESIPFSCYGLQARWQVQLHPVTRAYDGEVKEYNKNTAYPSDDYLYSIGWSGPGIDSDTWKINFDGRLSPRFDLFTPGSEIPDLLIKADIYHYRDDFVQTMKLVSEDGDINGSIEYFQNTNYMDWHYDPNTYIQYYKASRNGSIQESLPFF